MTRERATRISLYVAAAWGVCVILGWIFQPGKFYQAWLMAWLFWLGLSLGATGNVMLHHLMGGHWGYPVRRFGEHAGMMVGLMIVLFVPIIFGMGHLFPWANAAVAAQDAVLRHETPYLNERFFFIRAAIYAVVWLLIAWYLRSGSLRYEKNGNTGIVLRMYTVSAFGMVLYFALMSFAGVDWIMSRERGWTSTVFGFVLVIGQCISGLCAMIVSLVLVTKTSPAKASATENQFNDLGNLLLTLVILWAYLSFAQLLVIWMGNKQDEIPWYVHRVTGGWAWVGLALIILHFFVPFFVLLMRELKRKAEAMLWLCGGLLVMRVFDVAWQVDASTGSATWMDFVFPIGMGGLWVAGYLWLWGDRSLVPANQENAWAQVAASET